MKKLILFYLCSQLLIAQLTYESANSEFKAHRINYILSDSSGFGLSLFSSQIREFKNDFTFSNHSSIILGTIVIGLITTEVHSSSIPYHLIPFTIICAPILLGNSQYTIPIDHSFSIKFGLRTDYFKVLNFNWKRISEFFISTNYIFDSLNFELKYNRTITNHYFHKYPNYFGIAIGYDITPIMFE